jgi:hypothetical protein
MQMYSPIGGYMDVPGTEVAELTAKGWFAEGTPGFVDRFALKNQPLAEPEKPSTLEPQPAVVRVGRPRRGSQPT